MFKKHKQYHLSPSYATLDHGCHKNKITPAYLMHVISKKVLSCSRLT